MLINDLNSKLNSTEFLETVKMLQTSIEERATKNIATTSENGLMSSTDKTKLDGLSNYTHPTSSGNKHIPSGGSSGQILRWSADGTATWGNETGVTDVATTSKNGLMSSSDKSKLDGIASGANNYTHPTSSGNKHIPSGGSSGQILRWSADGTATWGAEINYSIATASANGLMSSSDKSKLDGIASGANNYTHPNDANTRHVTDTEKSTWNSKAAGNHNHDSVYFNKTTGGAVICNGNAIALESGKSNGHSYISWYPNGYASSTVQGAHVGYPNDSVRSFNVYNNLGGVELRTTNGVGIHGGSLYLNGNSIVNSYSISTQELVLPLYEATSEARMILDIDYSDILDSIEIKDFKVELKPTMSLSRNSNPLLRTIEQRPSDEGVEAYEKDNKVYIEGYGLLCACISAVKTERQRNNELEQRITELEKLLNK